jgi:hypothetical protein
MAALRVEADGEALAERDAQPDRLGVAAGVEVRASRSLDTDTNAGVLTGRDAGRDA